MHMSGWNYEVIYLTWQEKMSNLTEDLDKKTNCILWIN